MKACTRSSVLALSAPIDDHRQPVLADVLEQLAQICDIGHRSRLRGSSSSAPSSSRSIPARCSRSHGTPPNCSACVISCSATQRRSCSAGASRLFAAWARLGATNSSRAGCVGLEDRELVLAEHATGEEAGTAPASIAITPPAPCRAGRACRRRPAAARGRPPATPGSRRSSPSAPPPGHLSPAAPATTPVQAETSRSASAAGSASC